MHNLGLFVIQKNKKTMIKEKGKEICQRVLDTNVLLRPLVNGGCMAVVLFPGGSDMAGKPVNIILPLVGQLCF